MTSYEYWCWKSVLKLQIKHSPLGAGTSQRCLRQLSRNTIHLVGGGYPLGSELDMEGDMPREFFFCFLIFIRLLKNFLAISKGQNNSLAQSIYQEFLFSSSKLNSKSCYYYLNFWNWQVIHEKRNYKLLTCFSFLKKFVEFWNSSRFLNFVNYKKIKDMYINK